MSKLHRQMEIDMYLGKYADDTRKIYLDAICKFEDHFGKSTEEDAKMLTGGRLPKNGKPSQSPGKIQIKPAPADPTYLVGSAFQRSMIVSPSARAIDAVFLLVITVIGQLITDIRTNQDAARQPNRQPQDVYQRVRLVSYQISNHNHQIAAHHWMISTFQLSVARLTVDAGNQM